MAWVSVGEFGGDFAEAGGDVFGLDGGGMVVPGKESAFDYFEGGTMSLLTELGKCFRDGPTTMLPLTGLGGDGRRRSPRNWLVRFPRIPPPQIMTPMECGGKRSATPLSFCQRQPTPKRRRAGLPPHSKTLARLRACVSVRRGFGVRHWPDRLKTCGSPASRYSVNDEHERV